MPRHITQSKQLDHNPQNVRTNHAQMRASRPKVFQYCGLVFLSFGLVFCFIRKCYQQIDMHSSDPCSRRSDMIESKITSNSAGKFINLLPPPSLFHAAEEQLQKNPAPAKTSAYMEDGYNITLTDAPNDLGGRLRLNCARTTPEFPGSEISLPPL